MIPKCRGACVKSNPHPGADMAETAGGGALPDMRKFVNEKRMARTLRLDPQPTRQTGNVLRFLRVVLIVTLLSQLAGAQNAPAPAASPAKSIGMFAYPKNKQSADQQLKDENECYASARKNSGVDPQAPAPAAASAEEQQAAQKEAAQRGGKDVPKGGAVKGSAKGAAGGAIAGDAGTGAASGATAAAMAGARAQKKAQKEASKQANSTDNPSSATGSNPGDSSAPGAIGQVQKGILSMHGCPRIFRAVITTGRSAPEGSTEHHLNSKLKLERNV